jgi:hypothetical protein
MNVEQIKRALQEPFFDSCIVKHGFAPFLRDYDVVAQIGTFQFLYRFTHCTRATVTTAVRDDAWKKSWEDVYTDNSAWECAGCPEGHVWGVCYLVTYPGARYVEDSALAKEWTRRLGRQMHEVRIETNGHNLDLIFHDLIVRELKEGEEDWVKEEMTRSE